MFTDSRFDGSVGASRHDGGAEKPRRSQSPVERHGVVVKTTGDSNAAFATARCAPARRSKPGRLVESPGPRPGMPVRIRVHGCCRYRDGDYHGHGVNRAAWSAAAHGGQVVVSLAPKARPRLIAEHLSWSTWRTPPRSLARTHFPARIRARPGVHGPIARRSRAPPHRSTRSWRDDERGGRPRRVAR